MKRSVLIIGFLSFWVCGGTQNQVKIDSLLQSLTTEKNDSNNVDAYNSLFYEFKSIDIIKAQSFARQGFTVAQKIDLKRGIAQSMNNLGITKKMTGDYDSAAYFYTGSNQIFEEINDLDGQAMSTNNLATIHIFNGDYVNAVRTFQHSLSIYYQLKDTLKAAQVELNIGTIYVYQDDFESALKYFKESNQIFEKYDNDVGRIQALNNIGVVYTYMDDFENAEDHYNKSIELKEKMGDRKGVAQSLNNIGLNFYLQENYSRSLEFYGRAIFIEEELNNLPGLGMALTNRAKAFEKMNMNTEALKDIDKALPILQKAGLLEDLKEGYEFMSLLVEKSGDTKLALGYFKMYALLKDSLFSETRSKEIGKLETKYEMEKKQAVAEYEAREASIKLREENIKRDNLQYFIILITIVCLVSFVFVLGKLKIPLYLVEGLVFFTFLLFFEFCLVLLDAKIEQLSGGEPLFKLLFNAILAGLIFPLHAYFERIMKKKLVSS